MHLKREGTTREITTQGKEKKARKGKEERRLRETNEERERKKIKFK